MTTETTPHLGLELFPEFSTHPESGHVDAFNKAVQRFNRTLKLIDAFWTGNVIGAKTTGGPPASPAEGDRYLLFETGTLTGDWAGKDKNFTVYLDGVWEFLPLLPGNFYFNSTNSAHGIHNGTTLHTFRGAHVPDTDEDTPTAAECAATLNALLAELRTIEILASS